MLSPTGMSALIYLVNLAVASVIISGMALAAEGILRRSPLPLRHFILLGGIATVLASPILIGAIQFAGCSLVGVSAAPEQTVARVEMPSPTPKVARAAFPKGQANVGETAAGSRLPAALDRIKAVPPRKSAAISSRSQRSLGQAAASGAVLSRIVWLIGIGLLSSWFFGTSYQLYCLGRGFRAVRTFLQSAEPVNDPRICRIATNASRLLRLRTCPALRRSRKVKVPLLLGLMDSCIVLPGEFGDWSDDDWLSLMIHEMAHIRRRDLAVGLIQRTVWAIYWWNPLVRIASAKLSILREQICDDLVSEYARHDQRYARLIVELAGRIVCPQMAAPAMAAVDGSVTQLRHRLGRLMDSRRTIVTSLNLPMTFVGVSVIAFLIMSIALVSAHVTVARASEKHSAYASIDAPLQSLRLAPHAEDKARASWKDMLGGIPKPKPPKVFSTQARPDELAGVVIDEQGVPVAGAQVATDTSLPGQETVTDNNGRFRLQRLQPNHEFEVEFRKDDYSPSLFIGKKSGSQNWTIVLTKGTWIEGRVLSPEGNPVADAPIEALRGPFATRNLVITSLSSSTNTDQSGRFRLNVEPFQYDVRVRVAGVGIARLAKLRIAAGEKKQIDLRLVKGADFRAVVRDSTTGKPVPGVLLQCDEQPDSKGLSDDKGEVLIPSLFPGDYKFSFSPVKTLRRNGVAGGYARWWSPGADRKDQRARCKDEFGNPQNFDDLTFNVSRSGVDTEIFAEPAVVLSGRVVDPFGDTVAGATVSLVATGTGNALSGDRRYSIRSDQMGQFALQVPASNGTAYHLVAHDGPYGTWRTWANGVSEPLRTLPGQQLSGLELRLAQPGIVAGRVVDREGRPTPGVKVRAISLDRDDDRYLAPTAATSNDGRFVLRFVAPGKQYVQLTSVDPIGNQPPFGSLASWQIVDVRAKAIVSGVELRSN